MQNLPPSLSQLFIGNGIDFNNGQTVIGGIIVGAILFGIPKVLSYFKHKYDTSIKTSYDIDTLFANYDSLRKGVDSNNETNKEILHRLDKSSQKIDYIIKDSKQTKFLIQELSKIAYDHDEILYEKNRYNSRNIKRYNNRVLDKKHNNRMVEEDSNDNGEGENNDND